MACDVCDKERMDGGCVRLFATLKGRESKRYQLACIACYEALKVQNQKDRDKLLALLREARATMGVESFRSMRDGTLNLLAHLKEDPFIPYRPCSG